MKPIYHHLIWDTGFFGFPVGRITGNLNSPDQLREAEKLIRDHHGTLTYYASPRQLSDEVLRASKLNLILTDRKVTYVKPIDPQIAASPNIESADSDTEDHRLRKLAIASGIYSRFRVDTRIGQQKFEELYSLWMERSLERIIASEVLICKSAGIVAGMVTMGEKNGRADIGIIAVDAAFRGKGIGTALMQSAEHWFAQKGYTTMQVVTQADNKPACKLYENCGFKVDSLEWIYHMWQD